MFSNRRDPRPVLLATVLALALAGCGGEALDPVAGDPARPVLVAEARPAGDPARRAIGTVRASARHVIAAATDGRVEALLVDVGETVAAGQPLLRLEAEVPAAQLAAARAERDGAAARLDEAMRHRARTEALRELGAASELELAQARVEADAAEAALAGADLGLAQARRAMDTAVLRAPVAGRIAARHAALSSVVGAGQPLLELDADGAREILAQLPPDAPMAAGDTVAWQAGAASGEAVATSVGERRGDGGARQAVLRISGGEIAPGALVEIALAGTDAAAPGTALLLPAGALLTDREGRHAVLVLDADDRLRAAALDRVEHVAGGLRVTGALAAGDRVVAAGGTFLAPGALVQPRAATR